jgi:hypothetical protein
MITNEEGPNGVGHHAITTAPMIQRNLRVTQYPKVCSWRMFSNRLNEKLHCKSVCGVRASSRHGDIIPSNGVIGNFAPELAANPNFAGITVR